MIQYMVQEGAAADDIAVSSTEGARAAPITTAGTGAPQSFQPFIDQAAVDILQPNVPSAAASRVRKIAWAAYDHNVQSSPTAGIRRSIGGGSPPRSGDARGAMGGIHHAVALH